jgi:putative ABC transport system permease protein
MYSILFKPIFRIFRKNKLMFFLCLLGLSIGYSVLIIIIMHTRFEYSFDNFQPDAGNIYRLHPIYGQADGFTSQYATSDNGYGPALKQDIPEIKDFVRMLAYQSERIITYETQSKKKTQYREPHVFLVDSNFFSFFNYRLKTGAKNTVLEKPNTMVISENAARKYFGDENPIGKTLHVSNHGKPFQCEVTGIFYNLPSNSNLQFDFLVSLETVRSTWPKIDHSWNYGISYTYIRVAEHTNIRQLEGRIMQVFRNRSGFDIPGNLKFDMQLVSMPDIHLDQPLQWELEKKGNRSETRYLLIIALVTIFISWINYINITTSQESQRAKTLQIKTILGSGKFLFVTQYVAETFFVNLVSLLIALLFILVIQSPISSFFGYSAFNMIFKNSFIILLVPLALLSGTLITGLSSAFIFWANRQGTVLQKRKGDVKTTFRQSLVVLQFATGIILIIGTLVILKQINYLRSMELGFDQNHTLVIKTPPISNTNNSGIDQFRHLLAGIAGIDYITAGTDIPGQFMDMGYMVNRTNINPPIYQVTDGGCIDPDYVKTLNLQIVAGEDFFRGTNSDRKVLINEEMVHLLNFKDNQDAIGKQIILPEIYNQKPVTILGVMKNYRQQSPSYSYKPVFFQCKENNWSGFNYFIVRYGGNTQAALSAVSSTWEKVFPNSSFDYYFLTDEYDHQYAGDIRFGKLFGFLSIIAIFISMLGLFGLTINTTHQRIKEIGIRKVNGATVPQIMYMLNFDFTKWILLAILFASPIAWYVMSSWLTNYATRTNIDWWIFALAGVLALGIALLTVNWQSWKAATHNPVEALKYE